MGLIDRLFGRQEQTKAYKYPPFLLESAGQDKFAIPRMSVPESQARLYQKLTWVSNSTSRVASSIAAVDLMVKQIDGEESVDVLNHPFEQLLFTPNPRRGRFSFFEATALYYLLTGNAYWWLNTPMEEGPPAEMFVIPSHKIEPVPDEQLYIKGYLYDPGNGKKIPLDETEIVHFRRFNPFNPYIGMSPVEALASVAVGDMKMQEWNTNFFGKNNAKVPGALAFADQIPDAEWERMKSDFKREHGDTKRNLMMLRGVGEGGVQWVQTAMSQSEMEFLEGRDFNKKEIYDTFAPGYYSWTSENSTEANSRAGRDAFFELAVYPILRNIQETITNKILPRYGEGLRAEYEDVRPKNIELEMKQIELYSRFHTIDEVRQKHFDADPLEDGSGSRIMQVQPQANEQKEKERDRFKRYAQKRIDEGTPEAIQDFTFNHLDLGEQQVLKAQYKVSEESQLVAKITEAIDELRAIPSD